MPCRSWRRREWVRALGPRAVVVTGDVDGSSGTAARGIARGRGPVSGPARNVKERRGR